LYRKIISEIDVWKDIIFGIFNEGEIFLEGCEESIITVNGGDDGS